jgi:uroporphyrinogen decarboxylase
MNVNNWIESILQSHIRYAIPIMTHPGIEMLGYTVKDAVQNGEIHSKSIKALNNKYPSKASTMIMDLTVEAEAFGCKILFSNNGMPNISGKLINVSDIELLKVPSLSTGRVPEFLKASAMAVKMIRDKAVLSGVIGPFSLAGRLLGVSEIMTSCYLETEAINLLLEKCTQFILSYCEKLKKLGCMGVIIAEPAAGLLSNDDCMQFSSLYIKRIVEAVQDNQFLVVLHNCGNTGHCTEAMLFTGAKAYHFGNAANMIQSLEQCPSNVLVMGNIDPVGVLKMMSPTEVEIQVSMLLEQTSLFPNFILSTGCDVPPNVNISNIQAFYNALMKFNKKCHK